MWFRAEALVIVPSRPVSIYVVIFLKKKKLLLRYSATFDSTSSNLEGHNTFTYSNSIYVIHQTTFVL